MAKKKKDGGGAEGGGEAKASPSLLDVIREKLGGASGAAGGVKMWMDTGNLALNWVVSGMPGGGYPAGRVVEIAGDPSTGKTLLLYHLFAEAQRRWGAFCFLDDAEYSHEPGFAAKLGVDCESLTVFSSKTVSDHAEAVKQIIGGIRAKDKKTPVVIALDALAILASEHEVVSDFDKRDMTRAQDIHRFFRVHRDILAHHNVLYVLTNHQIASLVSFGPTKTTPGGGGPKYQASVRLALSRRGLMPGAAKEAPPVGVKVVAQAAKNKVTAPFKMAPLDIHYSSGVDRYSGFLDILVAMGVAERDGKEEVDKEEDAGGRGKGPFSKPVTACKLFGGERLTFGKLPEFLEDAGRREAVFKALELATA